MNYLYYYFVYLQIFTNNSLFKHIYTFCGVHSALVRVNEELLERKVGAPV
jgi:hypothetical protein